MVVTQDEKTKRAGSSLIAAQDKAKKQKFGKQRTATVAQKTVFGQQPSRQKAYTITKYIEVAHSRASRSDSDQSLGFEEQSHFSYSDNDKSLEELE